MGLSITPASRQRTSNQESTAGNPRHCARKLLVGRPVPLAPSFWPICLERACHFSPAAYRELVRNFPLALFVREPVADVQRHRETESPGSGELTRTSLPCCEASSRASNKGIRSRPLNQGSPGLCVSMKRPRPCPLG